MKTATPQFDEVMTAYLEYAAAIEGKTVENLVAKLRRQLNGIDSSLKRKGVYTLQSRTERHINLVIGSHEWQHRLPESYTYSNRKSALERCWNNMLANRAALA
jgi:hypothetical protein